MHFLVLKVCDLALQEAVFATEFRDFRGGGEGALDAVRLHGILEQLELFSAGVEGVFEGAILVLQVALDGLDAGFEGDHNAVDVLDGV